MGRFFYIYVNPNTKSTVRNIGATILNQEMKLKYVKLINEKLRLTDLNLKKKFIKNLALENENYSTGYYCVLLFAYYIFYLICYVPKD